MGLVLLGLYAAATHIVSEKTLLTSELSASAGDATQAEWLNITATPMVSLEVPLLSSWPKAAWLVDEEYSPSQALRVHVELEITAENVENITIEYVQVEFVEPGTGESTSYVLMENASVRTPGTIRTPTARVELEELMSALNLTGLSEAIIEVHVSVKVSGAGVNSGASYAAEITPTSIGTLTLTYTEEPPHEGFYMASWLLIGGIGGTGVGLAIIAYTAPVLLRKTKKSKKEGEEAGGEGKGKKGKRKKTRLI